MDEVFKTIGAVIAGLGGSSVIIIGLSSWLGKIWANKMYEEQKLTYGSLGSGICNGSISL